MSTYVANAPRGTGLTSVGAANTILSSNGTSLSWVPQQTFTNFITSVEELDLKVIGGQLSFSTAFRSDFSAAQGAITALSLAVYEPVLGLISRVTAVEGDVFTNTTAIGVLFFNAITLTVPPFLSVTGSPASAGEGDFVIGLGEAALPTTNGYSYSLTLIGEYLRR